MNRPHAANQSHRRPPNLLALALALGSCGDNDPRPPAAATGSTTQASGGPGSSGSEPELADSTGPSMQCFPGEVVCTGPAKFEECAPDGQSWASRPCPERWLCVPCTDCEDVCQPDPCSLAEGALGCGFVVDRLVAPANDVPDAVSVANLDTALSAAVTLFEVNSDADEILVQETMLGPGEVVRWSLDLEVSTARSQWRRGGLYRIRSDFPVSATYHSAEQSSPSNESSLLLPDAMLGVNYVVASYSPYAFSPDPLGYPSYFEVVGLSPGTTVQWTAPTRTEGGSGVVGAAPLETGSVILNTYEVVRVSGGPLLLAGSQADLDLSGTVLTASEPVWVASGTRCSRVPSALNDTSGLCDALQEVLVPIEHWGHEIVAAPPPTRNTENHHWRVFAGADGTTTFRTTPQVLSADNCPAPAVFADGACTLPTRGAWVEIEVPNGEGFVVRGLDDTVDRLMVVGYLQGSSFMNNDPGPSTEIGDPAMYQMPHTGAFQTQFTATTSIGFAEQYVQIVRPLGGATVFMDGVGLTNWETLGEFEYATPQVVSSVVELQSGEPFGVTQFGYTDGSTTNRDCTAESGRCYSGYAHPLGWATPPGR